MNTLRIAILGGGLAGLTTAYLLKQNLCLPEDTELEIKVFEATKRPGGRVYTLRKFKEELYAEAGALSISNCDTNVLALAEKLGVTIIERPDRSKKRYFTEGQWNTESDSATIIKFIMQKIIQTNALVDKDKQAASNDLDKITLMEFLEKSIVNGELIIKDPTHLQKKTAATLLGLYAGDITKLSAWDAFRYLHQYKNTKSVYSVKDGNDQLTSALYNAINQDECVKLNAPVTHIKTTHDGKFNVVLSGNHAEKHAPFDYVVVAVPLTALQLQSKLHIQFEPPLPKEKTDAINGISYNRNVARIYFEESSRFWLKDSPTANAITDSETLWIEEHSAYASEKKHAILEAHASGSLGNNLIESKQPEAIAEKEMANVYGQEFTNARTKKLPVTFFWNKNPYQNGGYPFLEPGQKKYIAETGRHTGKIFFAGDYTSIEHPASMEGAVRSGHKVFKAIQNNIRQSIHEKNRYNQFANLNVSFWKKNIFCKASMLLTTAAVVGSVATLFRRFKK